MAVLTIAINKMSNLLLVFITIFIIATKTLRKSDNCFYRRGLLNHVIAGCHSEIADFQSVSLLDCSIIKIESH